MPERYLEPTKSVIISSPAGSGKTEKLARRYISLLKEGSGVKKILCITFTEKAAAEMKDRILSILEREDPELLSEIRPQSPLMRISTIHAFCLKILKRFSIELGLDPSLDVTDEHKARDLWNEAMYDTLMAERQAHGPMFEIMRDRGLKGWGPLKRGLDALASKAPFPEMLLATGIREDSIEGDKDEGLRMLGAYAKCLERYADLKQGRHLLDFNDLELLAYRALSTVPDAHSILYSFDEHTDHILVDEFQDTSSLQWALIDRLTEEWRSGQGPKREAGKSPTIFLVGDEKQSIYLFRGANVAMFGQARQRFQEWLGSEYHFVEATENYRCLPMIVEFTNRLFSRIMVPDDLTGWRSDYTPFKAMREGDGSVNVLLTAPGNSARDTRANEAASLARLMRSLNGTHEIYDNDGLRPCRYEDMAILLKKRTHLDALEQALMKERVPFIVVKGIGFFDEPEVALLRELISFIVDPLEDYPLFALLRSPLFSIDYPSLHALIKNSDGPLIESLMSSTDERHRQAAEIIHEIINSTGAMTHNAGAATHKKGAMPPPQKRGAMPLPPLAVLIERTLDMTGGWRRLGQRQRHANVRKFISMVESYEAEGMSPIEIRERLLRLKSSGDSPKANISSEGMDAVKIMTIHAAKGLQFPMVFLPGMDESIKPKSEPIVFDDTTGRIQMGFEEESAKRKKKSIFRLDTLKHEQEEKRLLYVAITRARDYLLMSGSPGKKITGRLQYLDEAFGLLSKKTPGTDLPFEVLTREDIDGLTAAPPPTTSHRSRQTAASADMPVHIRPLEHTPAKRWEDVTDEEKHPSGTRAHGEGRTIIGTVLHRVFEEVSKGRTPPAEMKQRTETLLSAAGVTDGNALRTVPAEMDRLMGSGIMEEIILPREKSHAELPFMLDKGDVVYSGRIDRVIVTDSEVRVYDYKTFVVNEDEAEAIANGYQHQMSLYREAASVIFMLPARAFVVLTSLAKVIEVDG